MTVDWTERATRDLRAAYDYWAEQESERAASRMLQVIFSAVEILERFPEVGRCGRIPGTRELVISPTPFLIAYRVRPNSVEILALLHGARKWPGSF